MRGERDELDDILDPEPVGYEVELRGNRYQACIVYEDETSRYCGGVIVAISTSRMRTHAKARREFSRARAAWRASRAATSRDRVILVNKMPRTGPRER